MRESGELSLPPSFCITYMIINIYYPGEPVNIHIQSLINIIQKNNRVITTKKGKGKLSLFRGNGERVNTIYARKVTPRWEGDPLWRHFDGGGVK